MAGELLPAPCDVAGGPFLEERAVKGLVSETIRDSSGDHRNRVLLAETNDELVDAGPGDSTADQRVGALRPPQRTHRLADSVRVRGLRVSHAVISGASAARSG